MLDFCVRFSPSPNDKLNGAYYTDFSIANLLTQWAIRSNQDNLLDPSFGGGIFLQAGYQQLQNLGAKCPEVHLFGVELDKTAYGETIELLKSQQAILANQLIRDNFFSVNPKHLKHVDAIVGNPPFIRFQNQSEDIKIQALELCQNAGVKLSSQSNLWAPFIIHSCNFLKDGGRLALVIPQEIAHAKYAKPLLEFLARTFERTTFISFENPLFKHLNQDVILLLAENKGKAGKFHLKDVKNTNFALTDLANSTEELEPEAFIQNASFSYYWLPVKARSIYEAIKTSDQVQTLADVSVIKNGYVTGANNYFHVSKASKKEHKLHKNHLQKTILKTASLQGLRLTEKDWQEAEKAAKAAYVLNLPAKNPRSLKARAYLQRGIESEIHTHYKCRNRDPWHRIPNLTIPDAFLSYMSGPHIHLVHNEAQVSAPNSLHHINMKKNASLSINDLCALWPNTFTQLSAEIEGRSLGGGMLKLEPSEARRICIPMKVPYSMNFDLIDTYLRKRKLMEAQQLANSALEGIVSKQELDVLQDVLIKLRKRRRKLKN